MTAPSSAFGADVVLLRLHALTARGYISKVVLSATGSLHSIELEHPRASKKRYVPKLALWSDGVLATNGLLWPEQFVPSERVDPPFWQKCIASEDAATFSGFAASVPLPGFIDLRLRPLWRRIQSFGFRMVFGTTLCFVLALPMKMAASAAGLT